jgi:hypothetical protein
LRWCSRRRRLQDLHYFLRFLHEPSEPRRAIKTRTRVPGDQDRTVGEIRGRHWGELAAASGEFRWPPTGRISWPRTGDRSPPPAGLGQSIAPDGGGCHRAKGGEESAATLTAPLPAPPSSKSRGRPASNECVDAALRRVGRPAPVELPVRQSFRSYVVGASDRDHGADVDHM